MRKESRDNDKVAKKRFNSQGIPWWLWLLKHSQAIVTAGMTVGVMYYHNTQGIYLTATALITSFMAKGMKKCINQPRPDGSIVKTPGMPSTHSATGTFISLYLAILLARTQASSVDPTWLHPLKPILIPSLITFPVLMIYSRVRLGVHTTGQCIAGAALGVSTTILFYTLWNGHTSAQGELFGCKLAHGLKGTHMVKEMDVWLHELFVNVFKITIPTF